MGDESENISFYHERFTFILKTLEFMKSSESKKMAKESNSKNMYVLTKPIQNFMTGIVFMMTHH